MGIYDRDYFREKYNNSKVDNFQNNLNVSKKPSAGFEAIEPKSFMEKIAFKVNDILGIIFLNAQICFCFIIAISTALALYYFVFFVVFSPPTYVPVLSKDKKACGKTVAGYDMALACIDNKTVRGYRHSSAYYVVYKTCPSYGKCFCSPDTSGYMRMNTISY